LAMMLLQVPLITLLIAISFHRFMEDNADADRLARTVHYFRAFKTPYEVQGATVPLYAEIIPRVRASVAADRRLISVPSANQRGKRPQPRIAGLRPNTSVSLVQVHGSCGAVGSADGIHGISDRRWPA